MEAGPPGRLRKRGVDFARGVTLEAGPPGRLRKRGVDTKLAVPPKDREPALGTGLQTLGYHSSVGALRRRNSPSGSFAFTGLFSMYARHRPRCTAFRINRSRYPSCHIGGASPNSLTSRFELTPFHALTTIGSFTSALSRAST